MPARTIPLDQARILVIEDDPNNRLVAVKLLQVAGVSPNHITEASEGTTAAATLHTMPTDNLALILLDLQLPGKDGYTILRELRANPALAHTPIVALTANVMKSDVEQARMAGFDGFIGKPIDGRRFPDQIRRLLAGEPVWEP